MTNVVRLFQDRAFDPETIKLLVHAYDRACSNLNDASQLQSIKEVIARRIIKMAENGERDVAKLMEHALLGLQWTQGEGSPNLRRT